MARIASVSLASMLIAASAWRPDALRVALAASSCACAVTAGLMAIGCWRLALLPRAWNGGALPALAGLAFAATIVLDVANLDLLREFVATRTPGELSTMADHWSAYHRLSALIVSAAPLMLLVPLARIAHGVGDTVLAQRAKLFGFYLPIAVGSVGYMLHLGYGPTSIVLPAGLPVSGPFGIVMLSLLAVFAALLFRLRNGMSRMRMPTDERGGAAA